MTQVCEICSEPILGARRRDARFHSWCRREASRVAASDDLHLVAGAKTFWNGYGALRSRRSPSRPFVKSAPACVNTRGATQTHIGGAHEHNAE